jgi:hypothetical protein
MPGGLSLVNFNCVYFEMPHLSVREVILKMSGNSWGLSIFIPL